MPEQSVAPATRDWIAKDSAQPKASGVLERIDAGRYHHCGKYARVRIDAQSPLVLGSASPRRRELVAMLGVPFVVRAATVDETAHIGEEAHAYLERVVRAKLDAVRATDLGTGFAVLVADTIVVAPDGAVLGKPRDDDDARAMIERLAGATHEVSTRFVLARRDPDAPPSHAQSVTTRVTLRALTRREVLDYAAAGEGMDKAGAYGAQGKAAAFVERIEGSYTNVVGLPLCEVVVAMRGLGLI